MKKTFASAFLVSVGLFGGTIFHTNQLVMFNPNIGNQTGISLSVLQEEFPQDLMITQGKLVGHLDWWRPADLVVWTTPWTNLILREDPIERFVPPIVPPNIGEPPVHPPVIPPIVLPGHDCYHECHPDHPGEPPPPTAEIPEPSTFTKVAWGLVFIGAVALLVRERRGKWW